MLEILKAASLLVAAIAMGLISGLFYGYSCSVIPGLGRTGDRAYILAFQRINVAIINGWFLASFLGAPVFTALAAVLNFRNGAVIPWVAASLILYGLTIGITAVGNIPLNNALAAAGEIDTIEDPAAVRRDFEPRWNRLHLIRTLTSLASFACLAWALVQYGRVGVAG